jgi:hypothetical protein
MRSIARMSNPKFITTPEKAAWLANRFEAIVSELARCTASRQRRLYLTEMKIISDELDAMLMRDS